MKLKLYRPYREYIGDHELEAVEYVIVRSKGNGKLLIRRAHGRERITPVITVAESMVYYVREVTV